MLLRIRSVVNEDEDMKDAFTTIRETRFIVGKSSHKKLEQVVYKPKNLTRLSVAKLTRLLCYARIQPRITRNFL
jgi:hypothetical protein